MRNLRFSVEHFTIVVVNVYREFVEIIIIVVFDNRKQSSSIFTAHNRFFDKLSSSLNF